MSNTWTLVWGPSCPFSLLLARDCTQVKYLGTSNAVKLTRFFDKVIERKYYSRDGGIQVPCSSHLHMRSHWRHLPLYSYINLHLKQSRPFLFFSSQVINHQCLHMTEEGHSHNIWKVFTQTDTLGVTFWDSAFFTSQETCVHSHFYVNSVTCHNSRGSGTFCSLLQLVNIYTSVSVVSDNDGCMTIMKRH